MTKNFVIWMLCLLTLATLQLQTGALTKYGDVCLRPNEKTQWTCEQLTYCAPAMRLLDEHKKPPDNFYCEAKDSATPVICCPPHDITDWNDHRPPSNVNISPASSHLHGSKPLSSIFQPNIEVGSAGSSNNRGSNAQTKRGKEGVISKAAAKCNEYKDLYIPKYNKLYAYAIGGEDAKLEEFVHMALLGYGKSEPPAYVCGGTLISEKFVLSAAHCEKHPKHGAVRTVLMGDLDISTDSDHAKPEVYNVRRRRVHANYNPLALYDDIMLLELDRDVQFNKYILPVCLQVDKHISETKGLVTGWGDIDPYGSTTNILQKVELPFVSQSNCNRAFKNSVGTGQLKYGILDATQICAGAEDGKDACAGDSGGPLQVPVAGKLFKQVGIVSFGFNHCGTAGTPGVYTRVSAYIPWIESIVWPEPIENSSAKINFPKAAPKRTEVSPQPLRLFRPVLNQYVKAEDRPKDDVNDKIIFPDS